MKTNASLLRIDTEKFCELLETKYGVRNSRTIIFLMDGFGYRQDDAVFILNNYYQYKYNPFINLIETLNECFNIDIKLEDLYNNEITLEIIPEWKKNKNIKGYVDFINKKYELNLLIDKRNLK